MVVISRLSMKKLRKWCLFNGSIFNNRSSAKFDLFKKRIGSVACAISGGVDSAVSAYLVKKKGMLLYDPIEFTRSAGYAVKGVFMTNWDPLDEGMACSLDSDREDAQFVCETLKIPFYEKNFVKEYWNYVFSFIKFNLLSKQCLLSSDYNGNSSFADAIATGHYCQNSLGNFLERCTQTEEAQLLRSADPVKDQTFWLSTISHQDLKHFMFPVGGLLKPQVKQIAKNIGLDRIASRRESMGICFIGKRRFSDFIDSYLEPKYGLFKDLETGLVLDEHRGIHHFTLGQRAPITKSTGPFYVCRLDYRSQTVYVVHHPDHPSLFMSKCWTGPAVWINSKAPCLESRKIDFQWQNKWRSIKCSIRSYDSVKDAAIDSCKDAHMNLPTNEGLVNIIDAEVENGRSVGQCLSIRLDEPMRCIAPGQWAALYDGQICLGGAMICGAVSLWDEGRTSLYDEWDYNDHELNYGDLKRDKAQKLSSSSV